MKPKIEHVHLRISVVAGAIDNCMVVDGQRGTDTSISLDGTLDLIRKELAEILNYLETEEF